LVLETNIQKYQLPSFKLRNFCQRQSKEERDKRKGIGIKIVYTSPIKEQKKNAMNE
jgi:hypothetical protein